MKRILIIDTSVLCVWLGVPGMDTCGPDQQTPWAAFSDQTVLWSPEKLKALADSWPLLADQQLSLGDATIKDVAEHYSQMGFAVEILTGDQGLKAYEPAAPAEIPRRRRKR